MVKKLNLLSFVIGVLFLVAGLTMTVYNNFTQSLPAGRQVKQNVLPAKISSVPTNILTISSYPSASPINNKENVIVTRVIDGDTIEILLNNKKETIRLIGIDAPEISKSICFGKEAKAKAEEVLINKTIQLERDSSQGERDRYQRLLAYIFLNSSNFNQLMIAQGFAKEYTYNKPYKYQVGFKNSEKEAKENKKGLWGQCD